MHISYNWLKKYIPDFEIHDVENFKNKLDTRLSEADRVMVKGEALANLVIGQIVSIEDHPTNKALHVCKVDVGEAEPRTIVCGAPNAREGLKSVICLPGGKVYDPKDQTKVIDIGERKMGTIVSAGMICSLAELGVGERHDGIIELPETAKVGTHIANEFKDIIIEIANKNLAHRPDAFSHMGIAREISAIFKTRFEQRQINLPASGAEQKTKYKVNVQDDKACPRYSGISIHGIKVAPSPLWLQIAVSYAGLRPINNIVDITNYIMLDMGQPLHAFDADKLDSNDVIVRKAKTNETIMTLDGEKRKLPANTLVIADRKEAIAIAGIMGGESTAVTDKTTNIFLEAANFEMYGIRRSSRELGLRTDASSRFEKGIDPAMTLDGLTKAAEMILDVCGGEISSELTDIYPSPEPQRIVPFNLNAVKRLQGIELDKSKLVDILSSLNLEIQNPERISADALLRADLSTEVNIEVPSYRRDIKSQEDILEEIARLYGYENVPRTLPKRDLAAPSRNRQVDNLLRAKKLMASSGLTEIYTYSMVGEQLYKDTLLPSNNLLTVANPISPELALIRNQIVPSLLTKVKQNLARYDRFGLFEVSRVALKEKSGEGLPLQPYRLAGLYVNGEDMETYRFLRQAIDNLNNQLCDQKLTIVQNERRNEAYPYMHPGKYATIELDGETIGQIGILHPLVRSNFDIAGNSVAVFEIEMNKIMEMEHEAKQFNSLSNFQPVIRDLSFWQGAETKIGDLLQLIPKSGIKYIESVKILDVFQAKDGKSSFTLRLTLSADHTLTQAEIGEIVEKVAAVAQKEKHQLRG